MHIRLPQAVPFLHTLFPILWHAWAMQCPGIILTGLWLCRTRPAWQHNPAATAMSSMPEDGQTSDSGKAIIQATGRPHLPHAPERILAVLLHALQALLPHLVPPLRLVLGGQGRALGPGHAPLAAEQLFSDLRVEVLAQLLLPAHDVYGACVQVHNITSAGNWHAATKSSMCVSTLCSTRD